MKKIAVIAGTPIDTQMGVSYIEKKGEFEPVFLPCFENPRQCHVFQMQSAEEKEQKMTEHFLAGKELGAEAFFIYCNSLAGAFDYDAFSNKTGYKTVTPLNAYARLAKDYSRVGVIAANNQATAGIERAFTNANEGCYVYGTGLLDMVEAIENKTAPEEICRQFRLKDLFAYYEAIGAQAIVLGCTHFPYIKEAAEKLTDLPVIDPADIMHDILKEITG
ncbi:MAG: aspartate/glutamate racemase family protein [Firmicutes bacterium]|nr:aspartate/glutamate racemase family protein [Bacillota bacterium]MBR5926012.1 aspartate/glutamate racemase family protein [Bacillota bacterium]